MPLRDATVDDPHLELLFVPDRAAGGRWRRWVRLLRLLANKAYYLYRRALRQLIKICDQFYLPSISQCNRLTLIFARRRSLRPAGTEHEAAQT